MTKVERIAKVATVLLSIIAAAGIVYMITSAILEQVSRVPGQVYNY
jgi:predicted PurR-regulated permease PerM